MEEYSIREKLSVDQGKKYYRPFKLHNGSSSPKVDKIRGIIDIAESSDDRFSYRSMDWSPAQSDEDVEEAPDFAIYQNLLNQQNLLPSDLDNTLYNLIDLNHTEESAYFILDIKLLSAGLQTIPFYKRMDYPAGIFNKPDIKRMNQEAEVADKNYTENYNSESIASKEEEVKRVPSGEKVSADETSSAAEEKENVEKSPEVKETPENPEQEAAPVAEAN